jgi:ubiquinone/menaquinone biosynthesis C-methylase UbiE
VIDYDQELRLHQAAFCKACRFGPADHVLDIGCGAGETTRDAARAANAGQVLGVDCSQLMIERARALTHGLDNIRFEHADVEHLDLAAKFDLAISRFGTMFFGHPDAAFAKIRLALQPHGRLVMMVWQSREQNEWARELQRVAAVDELSAFSLGDPAHTRQLLVTAGFSDVTFDEVHEPVFYGPDTESALEFVSQFQFVRPGRGSPRLRALIDAHLTQQGVWFDSRAWIVAARVA